MTDALDKGYNEGRLAFRRYFAKFGPNVKQNDPRMPPNPYVGYYGVLWLNGFESELRRHVAFTPSAGGIPRHRGAASPSLNARKSGSLLAGQSDAVSRSAKLKLIGELRENWFLDEGPRASSLIKSRRMSGRRVHLFEAGWHIRRRQLDLHKVVREPSAGRQRAKSLQTRSPHRALVRRDDCAE